MSSPSPERNLLFGLLALQNGFITRDQLVSAFGSWTADKRRNLEQILQEQGSLDDATLQLISALVVRHVSLHGGNAAQSLAQLNSIGASARHDLERLHDGQLSICLNQLPPVAADQPADAFATMAMPAEQLTTTGERFVILRPHAEGGLGQVAVALDTELHREVALKEIRAEHADKMSARSRFVREAEITGGLEHPGIVPVYGLGAYADGRPYYAMKFVKGRSLKTAIEDFHEKYPAPSPADYRGVEFRQLLQRFLDVCNAMQYAHDRGVLHRDLKPGNIMLGQYGETLIIDWGLAKPLGESEPDLPPAPSGEEPLIPKSSLSDPRDKTHGALGTPQYMSPEQAAGKLDDVGPATDVYALGATLYHLLTGKPPIELRKDEPLGELLARVQRGDYLPPKHTKPNLPRGLNAVCLKALSVPIPPRYAAPRDLAHDIEHWLADEAITAAPDTRLEQAARFARRHRGIVGTTMISLLVIAIGASAAGVVIRNQSVRAVRLAQQEREARLQAEAALQARDEALLRIARTDEGSVQLEDALQKLRDDPAFKTVRLLLLKRTQDDLNFVTQQDTGVNIPDLTTTQGYLLLQSAQLETDLDKRVQSATNAIETLSAAAQLRPTDRPLALRLSDAYNLRGQLTAGASQQNDFDRCRQIRADLLEQTASGSDGESLEIRRKWLSIRHNIALAASAQKLTAESGKGTVDKPELQQVAAERQALSTDHPKNSRLAIDLADSEMALARYASQDPQQMRSHYRQAIACYERAYDEQAGLSLRSRWSEALRGKLECELSTGDRRQARLTADELFQLTVRVMQNTELRDLVARGCYSSGCVAFESWAADPALTEQRTLAAEHLRLAVMLFRELTSLPGVEPRHWHDLAAAAALRGQVLESSPATTSEAVLMYRTARQALEDLQRANPKLFEDPATQLLWEQILDRLHNLPPAEDKS